MKKLFFALILPVFCFIGANFAQTQENSHPLRGIVKNQDSEVITGLRMIFKSGESETAVSTDINGDFKTALAPGNSCR